MPRDFPRSRRLQEQIQRVLGDALRGQIRDPRLKGLIITEVQLSKDLSFARVYYTTLGPAEAVTADLEAGLAAAAGYLRSVLASEIRARNVPELRFVRDEMQARAANLDRLIADAVHDDEARHVPEGEEPPETR